MIEFYDIKMDLLKEVLFWLKMNFNIAQKYQTEILTNMYKI